MTSKKSIFVIKSEDHWATKTSGSTRAGKVFATQAEAIVAGRKQAKKLKAEFVITGRDGKIRSKASYGSDPRNIKG